MNLSELFKDMLNKYDYNEYSKLATTRGWPVVPKQVFATQLGVYLVACYEHPELDPIEAYSTFYGIKKQGGCCGGSNNVL